MMNDVHQYILWRWFKKIDDDNDDDDDARGSGGFENGGQQN